MAPGRRRASPMQRHQWPCAHNTHKSTRMRSMLPIRPRRAPPCRCRAAAPASTPRMQRGGVFQSPYTHRKRTDGHADEYGQVGNPMCHTPHISGTRVVMRVKSLVEGGHASLPRPLASTTRRLHQRRAEFTGDDAHRYDMGIVERADGDACRGPIDAEHRTGRHA